MSKSHFNQYILALKNLVKSLENEESLRVLYRKEEKLYKLFDDKLVTKVSVQSIPYEQRLVFFESFYLWNYFYRTVGGNSKTISNIPLKTYPYFYVHKPLKKEHTQMVKKLKDKLGIIDCDFDALKSRAKSIETNIRNRKKINDCLRSRVTQNGEIDNKKAHNIFRKLFPYAPLEQGEVRCILTELSIFFVVPGLQALKRKSSYKKRSAAEKKSIDEFYSLINSFQFKYFENFPTFSIFDINEVDGPFVNQLIKETGIEEGLFRLLINSQTMLHFEETIEQYMIHDTWGHVWQAELAQGKVFYDELANRRVPFFPERTILIDQNVVAYTDLLYINFKGELSFDRNLAKQFIHKYFEKSLKLHLHATMSEMCAEITEYLFVFDYGNKIPLSSSSRFNHNPTKLDFAWSDVKYFSKMLNTPYKSLLRNKGEFNQFCSSVETLLKRKYRIRMRHIKSLRSFRSELKKLNLEFLEMFEAEFQEHFEEPFKKRKNPENHYLLKTFYHVLKVQKMVNHIFADFFGGEGEKLSRFRIVTLVYIYLLFESDPQENFWGLDQMLSKNLRTLLNQIN